MARKTLTTRSGGVVTQQPEPEAETTEPASLETAA